ncbi:MAG: long-chain fatty acid--CoA ligase, partial [Bacteroidales bacterium]|nr:long-chain fatty acid--CoA ligase [Bacteroidales bacterium]
SESIIVQRKNKLYALIVPNGDAVAKNNLSAETLREVMRQNIIKLNTMIPDYSVVSGYELLLDPFAKTPKGSIKRFMYV